jgi:hypothetical protein
MLTIGILDANEIAVKDEQFIDGVTSVVGNWLKWELQQADIIPVAPAACDVLFLVHSGQVDWQRSCRAALKRHKIEIAPDQRRYSPLVITGGAIDANPYTWSLLADACSVGEAYLFVRQILDAIRAQATVHDLVSIIEMSDHALSRRQVMAIPRDTDKPWRLQNLTAPIATPDDYVDWEANPLIRSADKVLRVIASKGCHLKCKFCATTYRQTYRVNPDGDYVMKALRQATQSGERLTLITNDVAGLPYFTEMRKHGALDSQSLTIKAVRDADTFKALLESNIKIVRFGVEGISERIRHAFGKPIPDDELIEKIGLLHDSGRNTHMFYIVGSPYETDADWRLFQAFYARLAKRVRKGICRLKFTAFEPNAPTPLGYFITGEAYYAHMQRFTQWVADNWASRHLFIIKGRKPETRLNDLADLFGVRKDIVARFVQSTETINLAPTIEEAYRMPWEIINWYMPTAKRWHLAQSYMKWMEAA